jgi:type-F conjugative transfer system pilin assembly protein TrbC
VKILVISFGENATVVQCDMKKKKHYFLTLFFTLLLVSNSFAAVNYNDEAQKLDSTINSSKAFNNYLEDAKNLDKNQKPNPFLADKNFVQKLTEANNQIFDNSLSNQQLKQIFPSVDFDALKTGAPQINQLMIFVSSSMPLTTLKQFAVSSNKANGILVLRGLVGNSFKQTVAFVKTLNDAGTKAIIDPIAFNLFDVQKVPEIVVIIDNNDCKLGKCDHTPLFDKISGDITLEYALEEISKRGEFTKKEATRFLNLLRGGNNG